jgi:hypothetical protein
MTSWPSQTGANTPPPPHTHTHTPPTQRSLTAPGKRDNTVTIRQCKILTNVPELLYCVHMFQVINFQFCVKQFSLITGKFLFFTLNPRHQRHFLTKRCLRLIQVQLQKGFTCDLNILYFYYKLNGKHKTLKLRYHNATMRLTQWSHSHLLLEVRYSTQTQIPWKYNT